MCERVHGLICVVGSFWKAHCVFISIGLCGMYELSVMTD